MLSKVEIIKSKLIANIKDGIFRVGESITSRNKLCRKYNYSRTTVDRAIRELTASGYLGSCQGSRTYVISDKPIERPQRLFVISSFAGLHSGEAVRDLFFPKIEFKIPLIGLLEEAVANNLNRLCQPGVAVIWITPCMESIHLMDYLAKTGVPQILINRKYADYDYVATDAKNSIKEGLSWLMIEAGRDIAFISYRASTDKPYLYERIIAFYESCVELGAHLNPDAVFSRDFSDIPSEIAEVGQALFAGGKPPKGIFVMHQALTLPLVTVAQTYGFIPGRDYKLLTFDYIKELGNYAGIAMLKQQLEQLYHEAVRWLADNPAKPHEPFKKEIKTELITSYTNERSVIDNGDGGF
ncbi:MAG: GntR family transcriptional regulator [Victivallaceae bacterium]|nr:GntR family transcriptional regulator [Victivallaceae bacterium]